MDQVRKVMRTRHYSLRTEQAYGDWIQWFIVFHRRTPVPPAAGANLLRFFS